jgi:Holliday junction resolvase RusA-like endonuclease
MSSVWSVTVWGQPISTNDLYTIVWRTSSSGRKYKGIGKTPKATKYQQDAVLQMRVAKPSKWKHDGYVRVVYRMYLGNDTDSDNVVKCLSDALQEATGINDRSFLHCIASKEIGHKRPRVDITISSEMGCHCPVLEQDRVPARQKPMLGVAGEEP